MARIVKSGLIQLSLAKTEGEGTIPEIMEAMLQKHIPYIEEAGRQGVQILCFQEIFNTPYFCPGQDSKWYASAESVPGPTTERMQEYAKKNTIWSSSFQCTKKIRPECYTTPLLSLMLTELIWANTVKTTFLKPVVSGKNIFSNRGI
jgi:hypothetical protein